MPTPDVAATPSPEPISQQFVEYVWHEKGENFSDEALNKKIAEWNAIFDETGYDVIGANILTPRQPNEDYDFVWVMRWPSIAARDAAWAHLQTQWHRYATTTLRLQSAARAKERR